MTTDREPDEQAGFGLDLVLAALSRDLRTARDTATASGGFGLIVKNAEVELAVTVSRQKSAKGGGRLKFQVVPWLPGAEASAEAAASKGDSRVHRIKLTLTPQEDLARPLTATPEAMATPEARFTTVSPTAQLQSSLRSDRQPLGGVVVGEPNSLGLERDIPFLSPEAQSLVSQLGVSPQDVQGLVTHSIQEAIRSASEGNGGASL